MNFDNKESGGSKHCHSLASLQNTRERACLSLQSNYCVHLLAAVSAAPAQELQREVSELRVRSETLQRANANFRASGAAGALAEELADATAELAALREEMAER
jgi:hypothetical protein